MNHASGRKGSAPGYPDPAPGGLERAAAPAHRRRPEQDEGAAAPAPLRSACGAPPQRPCAESGTPPPSAGRTLLFYDYRGGSEPLPVVVSDRHHARAAAMRRDLGLQWRTRPGRYRRVFMALLVLPEGEAMHAGCALDDSTAGQRRACEELVDRVWLAYIG